MLTHFESLTHILANVSLYQELFYFWARLLGPVRVQFEAASLAALDELEAGSSDEKAEEPAGCDTPVSLSSRCQRSLGGKEFSLVPSPFIL